MKNHHEHAPKTGSWSLRVARIVETDVLIRDLCELIVTDRKNTVDHWAPSYVFLFEE